ncbi:MAG: hypothetical protein JWQ34_1251 [Mucilaginibacter sp.]|uniref:hypothetical protein n=1 Tax=Mucilaginibacter sp. TaxID=1882438 RepID=UPI0026231AC4|nr:hypothetical protein [Mucilaginibacter sp.]MDB5003026.1 hypothetical protein [Mucilaginibacter sp.]
MKNLTLIAFAALMAFFVLQGCQKAGLADIGDGKIKATKTEIEQYDLDTLLFTGAAATDSVKWTVTPANSSSIQIKGNAAIIYFFKTGVYSVSAQKISGGVTQSITITAVTRKPPVFIPDAGTTNTTVVTTVSDTTQFEPITGDVQVGAGLWREPNSGKVVVNFSPRTVNTYCSKGIMQYTAVVDASQNFSLDLVNIREPKGCAGATAPNSTSGGSQVFKNKLLDNGTHQIKITLNGVTYTGTIVITDTTMSINWPYTSGVIVVS